jgi:phosphoglycerate dehydrogenase-like enzyme
MGIGDYCDEIFEKTVGIVGLGKIGSYVAKKCKQVEMRVIGVDLFPVKNEWVDHCYSTKELDKLLAESDFVVLNVALTRETEKMIDEKALRLMKKSAILLNVARGGVVDEAALISALKDGTIAGAGLDVFADEPLPKDSPLWDLENVIITPHVSARSPYYMDRTTEVIIDNLKKFESGEPLLYVADKSEY